jgi:hypothetical protein
MFDKIIAMGERRHHWWNGKWGRAARRDITIYEGATSWAVEALDGGIDGDSRWWDVPDEDTAMLIAYYLMAADSDEWRDMSLSVDHRPASSPG